MKAPAMITHGEKGSNLGLFDEPDRMQSKLWRTESQEKVGLLFSSRRTDPTIQGGRSIARK